MVRKEIHSCLCCVCDRVEGVTFVFTEIEMVVMEKCKVSELTEQNITDEEKTAAATRTHTQKSRYTHTHVALL